MAKQEFTIDEQIRCVDKQIFIYEQTIQIFGGDDESEKQIALKEKECLEAVMETLQDIPLMGKAMALTEIGEITITDQLEFIRQEVKTRESLIRHYEENSPNLLQKAERDLAIINAIHETVCFHFYIENAAAELNLPMLEESRC